MTDPYQPPSSSLGPQTGQKLYTPQGAVVATVLGSLAAGIVVLVLNYRALGKPDLAQKSATWGGLLYLLLIGLAALLPDTPVLGLGFIAVQAGIAYLAADKLQGPAVSYHLNHGGTAQSLLRAAGVGLLTGLALLLLLILATTLYAMLTGQVPAPPATPER